MAWNGKRCFAFLIYTFLLSSFRQSLSNFTRNSLEDIVKHYALAALSSKAHTGFISEVSLPANLSGMEASVVRFRSRNFRMEGLNFRAFSIPPNVTPIPHVKRLALMFQNLGNWSSYYSLEGYSLVTPVVGFLAYDASHLNETVRFKRISLNVSEDPISIHFPQVALPERSNFKLKCVRYGADGSTQISEIISTSWNRVCFTRVQGLFSIAAPLVEPKIVVIEKKKKKKKKKETLWKCSVIGFALASIGLLALASIVIMVSKYWKAKHVGETERKADDGDENFNYVWVRDCKMPSATVLRTQPALENREVP